MFQLFHVADPKEQLHTLRQPPDNKWGAVLGILGDKTQHSCLGDQLLH